MSETQCGVEKVFIQPIKQYTLVYYHVNRKRQRSTITFRLNNGIHFPVYTPCIRSYILLVNIEQKSFVDNVQRHINGSLTNERKLFSMC